jgi:hypothetical protein
MVRAERQVHTPPALTSDQDALNRTTRSARPHCTPLERGAMSYGQDVANCA